MFRQIKRRTAIAREEDTAYNQEGKNNTPVGGIDGDDYIDDMVLDAKIAREEEELEQLTQDIEIAETGRARLERVRTRLEETVETGGMSPVEADLADVAIGTGLNEIGYDVDGDEPVIPATEEYLADPLQATKLAIESLSDKIKHAGKVIWSGILKLIRNTRHFIQNTVRKLKGKMSDLKVMDEEIKAAIKKGVKIPMDDLRHISNDLVVLNSTSSAKASGNKLTIDIDGSSIKEALKDLIDLSTDFMSLFKKCLSSYKFQDIVDKVDTSGIVKLVDGVKRHLATKENDDTRNFILPTGDFHIRGYGLDTEIGSEFTKAATNKQEVVFRRPDYPESIELEFKSGTFDVSTLSSISDITTYLDRLVDILDEIVDDVLTKFEDTIHVFSTMEAAGEDNDNLSDVQALIRLIQRVGAGSLRSTTRASYLLVSSFGSLARSIASHSKKS